MLYLSRYLAFLRMIYCMLMLIEHENIFTVFVLKISPVYRSSASSTTETSQSSGGGGATDTTDSTTPRVAQALEDNQTGTRIIVYAHWPRRDAESQKLNVIFILYLVPMRNFLYTVGIK